MRIRPGRYAEEDLTTWDIDDKGNLAFVDYPSSSPTFQAFCYPRDSVDYESIQEWAEQNIKDQSFFVWERQTYGKRDRWGDYPVKLVIYFKNMEDAVFFRLSWV